MKLSALRAISAVISVTLMAGFGWFALVHDWRMALWCLGASMIAVMLAVILARPEP